MSMDLAGNGIPSTVCRGCGRGLGQSLGGDASDGDVLYLRCLERTCLMFHRCVFSRASKWSLTAIAPSGGVFTLESERA